jgi:hypothetical protein
VYGQEITTRLFNDFIQLVTYPLRFHRQRENRTHLEAPSCALWVPAIAALPTPSHGSAIAALPNIPAVCHRSFPAMPVGTPRLDSTIYYVRLYPYRLMVVLFSMGGRSMNRSLDLGMITSHRLPASHRQSLEPSASHQQVPFPSPQILFSTNRIKITITLTRVT